MVSQSAQLYNIAKQNKCRNKMVNIGIASKGMTSELHTTSHSRHAFANRSGGMLYVLKTPNTQPL